HWVYVFFFIDGILRLLILSKNKRSELDSVQLLAVFCEKSRLHLFQTLFIDRSLFFTTPPHI
ncbi:hypothetical protein, partial [Flavobacterium sp.]|uniref:hypothetical protein n=1 Tax=Flavobacterium sp. TaxID=239 RepID=UPI00261BD7BC